MTKEEKIIKSKLGLLGLAEDARQTIRAERECHRRRQNHSNFYCRLNHMCQIKSRLLHAVERGFRFLKDLMFFAHSLFLKNPSRIMALLMVMGLSLLIYALAEHHLRQQLVEQDQTIPDQKGKPTQHPTMRRVFQMFEGIHILTIRTEYFRQSMVTNVKEVHLQIATLLGDNVLKFYTFDASSL